MSDVTEVKAAAAADVAKVETFYDKVKAIVAAAYKPFAIGAVAGFLARLVLSHL